MENQRRDHFEWEQIDEDERIVFHVNRRQFILASLASAGSILLAGCGGGGSGNSGQQKIALTLLDGKGTIILPSGSSITISKVVNLFGTSAPRAAGAFDFPAVTGTPLLTMATGPTGKAVLYGFLQPGSTQLSARSTAIVLAYYVLGVGAYPAEVQNLYLTAIARAATLTALENAVSAAIVARGEGWLDASDGALISALTAIQHELAAGTLAPANKHASGRGVILDKTDRVSGLQVSADGAGSMNITNYYRRRSYLYVDRVSYKAKGSFDSIAFPAEIPPQPIKIIATKGVSNALADLGSLFAGQQAFYSPVVSGKISVPVAPDTAASTTYTATDVGIGVTAGDFAKLTQTQQDGWWDVTVQSILLDIVAPALAGIALPMLKGGIDTYVGFLGTTGALKDIVNALKTSTASRDKANAGNVSEVSWDTLLMIVKSDTLKNVFLQGLGDFILANFDIPNAPFELNGALMVVTDRAKFIAESGGKMLSFISTINIGFQMFDSITTGFQISYCNKADVFTVEVTNAIAKLNPNNTTANIIQVGIPFTATVTNADLAADSLLNYQWSCKCKFADISDGVKTNTTDGTSFPSNSKVLSYVPNGKAKGGDTETIQVDIYNGSYNHGIAIGTAVSIVTFNTPITPANPSVAVKTTRTFTAIVSDVIATGASYEWTISGGNGSIGSSTVVVTTTPSIVYTAGTTSGVDTLKVKVMDANGVVKTTGITSLTVSNVDPGANTVTVKIRNGNFDLNTLLNGANDRVLPMVFAHSVPATAPHVIVESDHSDGHDGFNTYIDFNGPIVVDKEVDLSQLTLGFHVPIDLVLMKVGNSDSIDMLPKTGKFKVTEVGQGYYKFTCDAHLTDRGIKWIDVTVTGTI